MPSLKVHCAISKERTGQEFEELHKWMDEATEYLGQNHRLERHFFTQEYKDYIKKRWGEKAIIEWLFHIALDNLETANKFAVDTYNKIYDEINIFFSGKEITGCDFKKNYRHSSRSTEWRR